MRVEDAVNKVLAKFIGHHVRDHVCVRLIAVIITTRIRVVVFGLVARTFVAVASNSLFS